MSLRSLIKNQWWWAVVLVLWVFEFLGVFVITNIQTGQTVDLGFLPVLTLTLLILVAKAVEYLTRPASVARQAVRHTDKKA
jgi:hypothetical protein